eukprot:scaffold5127_cov64-Phaeocystis_antarctica.AAC.5
MVGIAPRRERQPPRSDRATHSDLPSVSCGRLLHVAAQSLCMKPGFFSHSPWSAQEPQLGLLSVFPAGHSSCRRGTAAGAVEGRGDDWRGRGWPRSSRCTALSTGGGTRSAARCWLSVKDTVPTPPRAPRATALTRRRASSAVPAAAAQGFRLDPGGEEPLSFAVLISTTTFSKARRRRLASSWRCATDPMQCGSRG